MKIVLDMQVRYSRATVRWWGLWGSWELVNVNISSPPYPPISFKTTVTSPLASKNGHRFAPAALHLPVPLHHNRVSKPHRRQLRHRGRQPPAAVPSRHLPRHVNNHHPRQDLRLQPRHPPCLHGHGHLPHGIPPQPRYRPCNETPRRALMAFHLRDTILSWHYNKVYFCG